MSTTEPIAFEPIARTDAFTLYERPAKNTPHWINLELVRTRGRHRKHNWWLGWNGERLARNSDAAKLAEHQPEIYEWVISTLEGSFP